MNGPEMFGRDSRVLTFVKLLDRKTDRESVDRRVALFLHQSGDDRRINPAREERTQRDVASQTKTHGLGQRFP